MPPTATRSRRTIKKSGNTTTATTPHGELMLVTPEQATSWLERNTNNRNLRQGLVDTYARDIAQGNWRVTGEAIKFSKDHRILDGQHRLWAVVEANKPITTFVIFGLEDEAQSVMDSGKARTAGDHLRMNGEANPELLAAAGRLGCLVERGLLFGNRAGWNVTKTDIYEWVQDHPSIHRSAQAACGVFRRSGLPPRVIAYLHYRFSLVDADAADEFFERLSTMVGLDYGSPILALASRLRLLGSGDLHNNLPLVIHMVIRAWNAWRQDRKLVKMQMVTRSSPAALPHIV